MSDNPQQPTILVKKKDGTQVRMTMAEFREYKKGLSKEGEDKKTVTVAENTEKQTKEKVEEKLTSKSKEIIKKEDLKNEKSVDSPMEKNTSEFVESEFKQVDLEKKSKAVEMKASITHASPRKIKGELNKEESLVEKQPHDLSRTTPVKDAFVDQALSSVKKEKKVEKSAWNKEDHKSLLEEDVEELKQHKHLNVLPGKKEDQYSEFLNKINFSIPDELLERFRLLVLSRLKEVRTDEQLEDYVMRLTANGGLGLSKEQAKEISQTIEAVWHLSEKKKIILPVKEERKEEVEDIYKKRIKLQSNQIKPKLQDVVINQNKEELEEKQTTGPVDELKKITIVDMRRLGKDAKENFEILKRKFDILRQESFVLYTQGISAWQESPIYEKYLKILEKTLQEKRAIKEVVEQDGFFTWEEFQQMIKMQSKIKF